MVSFREARELIRLCHEMNYISDDEFLLLHTSYKSQNSELPYDSFSEFDLESFEEIECLAQFCTVPIPKTPRTCTCRGSTNSSYRKMQPRECLGWKRSFVYAVKTHVVPLSLQRYGTFVRQARSCYQHGNKRSVGIHLCDPRSSHSAMEPSAVEPQESRTLRRFSLYKGAPLDNCFGFVDGTVRLISKPV